MCVRYVVRGGLAGWIGLAETETGTSIRRLAEDSDLDVVAGDLSLIVLPGEGGLALESARWGLMPYWAKPPEYKPDFGQKNAAIANAETVFDKPSFRAAAKYRRCLVPATTYFERIQGRWSRMSFHEAVPFAFAGLFAEAEPGVSDVTTFAIVTTEANDVVGEIYGRMPVVLHPRDYVTWLDASYDRDAIRDLLVPTPSDWFKVRDAGPIGAPHRSDARRS